MVDRPHGWSRGPVRRLVRSKVYVITYRARYLDEDNPNAKPGNPWTIGTIKHIIPFFAEDMDPEEKAQRVLTARLRHIRERQKLELEVAEIKLGSLEVPVSHKAPAGTKQVVVPQDEYDKMAKQAEEDIRWIQLDRIKTSKKTSVS